MLINGDLWMFYSEMGCIPFSRNGSMCFFDTILYYWIIGQRMLKSVGILLFCSCCFQTCSMCFPLSGGGGEVDEHSETPRESGRSTGGMLKWGWVSQGTTTSGWIILTSLKWYWSPFDPHLIPIWSYWSLAGWYNSSRYINISIYNGYLICYMIYWYMIIMIIMITDIWYIWFMIFPCYPYRRIYHYRFQLFSGSWSGNAKRKGARNGRVETDGGWGRTCTRFNQESASRVADRLRCLGNTFPGKFMKIQNEGNWVAGGVYLHSPLHCPPYCLYILGAM